MNTLHHPLDLDLNICHKHRLVRMAPQEINRDRSPERPLSSSGTIGSFKSVESNDSVDSNATGFSGISDFSIASLVSNDPHFPRGQGASTMTSIATQMQGLRVTNPDESSTDRERNATLLQAANRGVGSVLTPTQIQAANHQRFIEARTPRSGSATPTDQTRPSVGVQAGPSQRKGERDGKGSDDKNDKSGRK